MVFFTHARSLGSVMRATMILPALADKSRDTRRTRRDAAKTLHPRCLPALTIS
jgi:hypothetical protein